MNSPHRSVKSLNATRRRAVELRQQGRTLKNVAQATGLSVPTIVAACKAYDAGGWAAVDVGRRGRRHGSGATIPGEAMARVRAAVLALGLAGEDKCHGLWDLALLCRWLKAQFSIDMTPRTASRQLARWGVVMGDLHHRARELGGWAWGRWEEDVFEPLAQRAKAERSVIFWASMREIGPGYALLYAHDRRGKMFWLMAASPVSCDELKDFLSRLQLIAGRKLHVLWCGAPLGGVVDLKAWFVERQQVIEVHQVPEADLRSTRAQLASPGGAGLSNPEHVTRIPMTLTHLQRLEAESIHIMREVVAEADNPVMLYSIGKDSAVMLHLAMKAFYPAKPPFPLLHVDTQWKFREMYTFRDSITKDLGVDLLVHINPEGKEKGINPFTHGSAIHTDIMKTEGLKQALDKYKFDAAFGGARRDEEKSRAKERIFSFRTAQHRWDPKSQRPELWKLYNARKHKGESMRVFPLSNWTELDIWQYIYLENIPIVPLYYSAERPVVERDGTLIMVDDDRMPLKPGEVPMMKKVRFRTLGCYPLTGAVESEADTLPAIIQEMLLTKTSERQGRVIDHDSAASMEKKKQEGYF